MNKLMLFLMFPLAACASTPRPQPEPQVVIQKEAVAVDAPCVPDDLAPAPDYVDTDQALKAAGPAGDPAAIETRYKLLWAGRSQRIGRLNSLEPIVAACPKGHVTKK